ncbi:hypothetical protein [Paenibacillus graminis]|uniref:hypothetical protein n=1 Tax=Paenibacillus graminis TaxID=189425 RepID=UPI002DBFFA2A|nr:hypothetical protein [Paenibacillus graminis]MEC0169798.1 hypothetical protein [Paenibacillus graminis]
MRPEDENPVPGPLEHPLREHPLRNQPARAVSLPGRHRIASLRGGCLCVRGDENPVPGSLEHGSAYTVETGAFLMQDGTRLNENKKKIE